MHILCPRCQCSVERPEAAAPEEMLCPACGQAFRLEGEATGPWIPGAGQHQPGPVEIGQIVSHYRIVDRLGDGGMGVVYRAHDTRLGRGVALKFLPQDYVQDPHRLERFQREAYTASALNHPHICTIHDLGEHDGQPFLVMELIEGRTLRVLAAQGLPLPALAQLGGQVAKALAVAHAAGIVHRDIKPENIMVRDDGYAKVVDFGLARPLPRRLTQPGTEDAEVTDPGTVLGTLRYMAPEQARGEPVGSASDIFSLGIVLYELATGRHPFPEASQIGVLHAIVAQLPLPPARLNPQIPAPLEALIVQMLEKDARLRPTAVEVDAALAQLAGKEASQRTGPAPATAPRHTVGRKKELAELHAGFESAASGRGLFLCVTGEPGIGKTTLVDDFLADLAATSRPCALARGRCSERLAGAEAYLPFLEALESLLHGEGGEAAARLMKAVAPNWYVQVAPLAAEDSALARVPAEARAVSQERLKREVSAFLQEVARLRPLVLFFDDLHWADASTVDLLAYLGSKCAGLRVLLVLTYRPTDLALSKHPFGPVKLDLQTRGVCREVALEFLSHADVERYLALEFPEHRFPGEFAALIHARTEGSPLFMADLLRYLRDRQVLTQEPGTWTLGQSIPDLQRELPESVRSMIQRKINQLSEEDRRLLVAASVQGYEFDTAVVSQVLARDPAEVEERLEELDRVHAFVRLVREQEFPERTLTLRYRFVHVLYQNALYAMLRPTRRAALSAAVARVLLGYYGEKSTGVAAELAVLFEAARDFARATEYFQHAAQTATRVFASQEAIVLARRGLELLKLRPDLPESAERELLLQLTLGVPLAAIKGIGDPEVERVYLRARELCGRAGETPHLFPVLVGLWQCYLVRSDYQRARELGEQLLSLAQNVGDPALLVQAHRILAELLQNQGEFVPAKEHFEQALALYDPQRHHALAFLSGYDPGVFCLSGAAYLLWDLGYPDQALQRSHEAIGLASKLGHLPSVVAALYFATFVHRPRREWQRVRELAERALTLATEQGFRHWVAYATIMRGGALSEQGRPEEGIAQIRQGLAAKRALGSEIGQSYHLSVLVEAYRKGAQVEEGLAVVAEALAVAERTGERHHEAELYRLKGELLLLLDPASSQTEGEACFRQAIAIARRQSAKSWELRAVMSLSRLYQKRGDNAEVGSMLAEIYGWFTEGLDTPDLQEAKALLQA
jgi:predicted ATPase